MIAAVYRCLYGADFVVESIRSILPYVDYVLVALAGRPWGSSKGVRYEGEWVPWPAKFDDLREKVEGMREPLVEVVDDYWPSPSGQYEHIVRDVLLPRRRATEILLMEPDWVFSEEEAARTFEAWNALDDVCASTRQVELWRTPAWRVPEREGRATPRFQLAGGTYLDAAATISTFVHNLGFCFSDETMRWKHLTALAFADEIRDTPPDPAWLDRWRNWKPGDRDLEISLGCAANIPCAVPYDERLLPKSIRRRYGL